MKRCAHISAVTHTTRKTLNIYSDGCFRLKTVTDLHKTLSGISIKEVNDDSLVLEIHSTKPLHDNNNEQRSLLLILKYKLSALKSCLWGAEVGKL